MSRPIAGGDGAIYTTALDVLGAALAGVDANARFAPVSITFDYAGLGSGGAAYAGEARITRRTRSIVFLDADVWRADDRSHAASITAVFRVLDA